MEMPFSLKHPLYSMIPKTVRPLPICIGGMSLSLVFAAISPLPATAQAKPKPPANTIQAQETLEILDLNAPPATPGPSSIDPSFTDPNELRPLNLDSSVLSIEGAQRLIDDSRAAVSAQDYPLAAQKLQDARQVLNELSNYHQELAASFSGIDNRIFESHRALALQSAQMRDQATYELALLYRAQNKPELAVPLLVQIIRSQNPTRELGKEAYQQLFELGFVDSPYPRDRDAQPTSNNR
jgi:hypothetical protein